VRIKKDGLPGVTPKMPAFLPARLHRDCSTLRGIRLKFTRTAAGGEPAYTIVALLPVVTLDKVALLQGQVFGAGLNRRPFDKAFALRYAGHLFLLYTFPTKCIHNFITSGAFQVG
jgi:hypothetical protein